MEDIEKILNDVKEALINLNVEKCYELISKLKNISIDFKTLLTKALSPAMKIIGDKYERGEYFIAELTLAAELFKMFIQEFKDRIEKTDRMRDIKVVLGVVKGDIHDLGKSIVASVLEANGFEVIDLGVDVPAEKFVEAIRSTNAQVLGVGAFLTTTVIEIKKIIELLKKEGLRDKVKVIIGGVATSEELAKEFGADAYAKDAFETVEKIRQLLRLQ